MNYYLYRDTLKEKEKELIYQLANESNFVAISFLIKDKIQKIHIGKSVGRGFLFNHNNYTHYKDNLKSIKAFVAKFEIRDEYDRIIPHEIFYNWLDIAVDIEIAGNYIVKNGLTFSRSDIFS